jgi:anti-sigma B factor antagonist
MYVTNRKDVEGTIVALNGEFDLAQQHRVNDAFNAAAEHAFVVIDLARAQYVDSTVLSCLIRLRNELIDRGGTLVLAGPRPMIRRLLDIAGLTGMFDIHASVAEVRERYGYADGQMRRVEIVADVID